MIKMFRNLLLSLAGLLAVLMLNGCGADEPVPVNFVSATPTDGEIFPNEWIEVTFDNTPTDVIVTAGVVTVVGNIATISGPFTPGPLTVTITWDDGAQTLHYTVAGPCCIPPLITGGTVKDGDTDVDPEAINSDGRIEIIFDQEVTGNITLETEDGDDVGWLGIVECNKGTLELVKGGELTNETIYVIRGIISDVEGNEVGIEITFVTRGLKRKFKCQLSVWRLETFHLPQRSHCGAVTL